MIGRWKPDDKAEYWLLGISLLTMLLYLYNIIAGKLVVSQTASLPRFSEVHEFLLLTASVAAFIFWTMRKEAIALRRGKGE